MHEKSTGQSLRGVTGQDTGSGSPWTKTQSAFAVPRNNERFKPPGKRQQTPYPRGQSKRFTAAGMVEKGKRKKKNALLPSGKGQEIRPGLNPLDVSKYTGQWQRTHPREPETQHLQETMAEPGTQRPPCLPKQASMHTTKSNVPSRRVAKARNQILSENT